MVASAFALSLIGLSAVQALPAGKTVEERQVWFGDGSGVFIPGNGELPPCILDGTGRPRKEQPPCMLPPIVGDLDPSTKKREATKRQVLVGDPSTVIVPGPGSPPICLPNIALKEQPPCILPPIVGPIKPSTKRRGLGKRQVVIGDPSEIFIPGPGELPPCLVDTPLSGQPPCLLPPIVGGLEPSARKREIEKRQLTIGDGTGIFIPGQGELPVCLPGVALTEQPPCLLPPIVGGLEPPFLPPKQKRGFVLPPDHATNPKKVIAELQKQLVALQNKKHKTKQDLKDIEALKAALKYLAGITHISAPPGTGTVFIPGKRGFVLPPDHATNPKKVIAALEIELVALQNKKHKTKQDLEDIEAIKGALLYLAGITKIVAPPGTGTVFVPGKRDTQFNLDTVGTYADQCPNLVGAQIALQTLMHKDKPTQHERIIMQQLAAFLKGCGITIVKSPDGTYTIIKPADKREAPAQIDVTGLEAAYLVLLDGATEIYPSQPSFTNWLAMKQLSDLLVLYGASTELTVDSAGHPKRQADQITVGTQTCQVIDVMALRAALAALLTAYGEPAKAPLNIFLIEQVLVTALQLCGQTVEGWTTIIPGSPVPGGPMVPQPTVPGAPLVPNPTVPGGPIKPSDKKRQAPVGDPAAMLAALTTLEDAYGAYGSGKIPAPVFLIMVNIVTILQGIPGVVVPGWPVLGQGSVVIGPST